MTQPSDARPAIESWLWRWILPACLFAGALAVNFARIDAKSFSLDESTSVFYSTLPLRDLAGVLTRLDPNMAAYYFVLRGWMAFLGETETAVRAISAIAAALAVLAIYALAKHLFGRTAGVVGALLLSANAFGVRYAQTARSYALVVLLLIVASHLLVLEIEHSSTSRRAGYAAVATLAFYTQHFAALVLLVHLGVLLAVSGRSAFTAGRVRMAIYIAVLCAPELVIAARVGASARLGWVPPVSLDRLRWALVDLGGESGAAFMVFVLLGCYGLLRGRRDGHAWRNAFAAAWFVVPIAMTTLVSLATPVFVSRFLIVSLPGLILFAVGGLAAIRSTAIVIMLSIGLVALEARQLRAYYRSDADENWRDATDYVLHSSRPGDGIKFFPNYSRRPFDYYVGLRNVSPPTNLERRALAGPPRIWLVEREYEADSRESDVSRLRAELSQSYRMAARQHFSHVNVTLYVR